MENVNSLKSCWSVKWLLSSKIKIINAKTGALVWISRRVNNNQTFPINYHLLFSRHTVVNGGSFLQLLHFCSRCFMSTHFHLLPSLCRVQTPKWCKIPSGPSHFIFFHGMTKTSFGPIWKCQQLKAVAVWITVWNDCYHQRLKF